MATPLMTETWPRRNKVDLESRGILKETFVAIGCGESREYCGKPSYDGNMVPKK